MLYKHCLIAIKVSKWRLSISAHTEDWYQFADWHWYADHVLSVHPKTLFLHFTPKVIEAQKSEVICSVLYSY